jgi:hypothetical protein
MGEGRAGVRRAVPQRRIAVGADDAGRAVHDAVRACRARRGRTFGNAALSLATHTTLTGGTAAVPTTAAANGVAAGGLVRIGALGDGDGNGQFYAVTSHATNDLTLVGQMDAAGASGAVVYPVVMLYPSTSPISAPMVGTRFRILTANRGYMLHGCWPMSYRLLNLNTRGRPQIEMTWGVSRWAGIDDTSSLFPSAVTSNQYTPAPIAAGSLNLSSSTSRNLIVYRNLEVNVTLDVLPLDGPGGVGAYQATVGAVRGAQQGGDSFEISFVADSAAALEAYGTGTTSYHLEWTGSTIDGKAIGFKCPKFCFTQVPVQINDGGVNRMRLVGRAYTGGTTTTELTRAPFVWGMA